MKYGDDIGRSSRRRPSSLGEYDFVDEVVDIAYGYNGHLLPSARTPYLSRTGMRKGYGEPSTPIRTRAMPLKSKSISIWCRPRCQDGRLPRPWPYHQSSVRRSIYGFYGAAMALIEDLGHSDKTAAISNLNFNNYCSRLWTFRYQ